MRFFILYVYKCLLINFRKHNLANRTQIWNDPQLQRSQSILSGPITPMDTLMNDQLSETQSQQPQSPSILSGQIHAMDSHMTFRSNDYNQYNSMSYSVAEHSILPQSELFFGAQQSPLQHTETMLSSQFTPTATPVYDKYLKISINGKKI